MKLDKVDKALIDLIQTNFPITPEPYRELAGALGLTEGEVIDRIRRLQESGVIRRLGGVFDSRKLGYTGTLCAAKVPPDRVDEVAEKINRHPGVTHNYLREHELNMWFTVLARSREKLDQIISLIKAETGIEEIYEFPAVKIFKIRVNFDVGGVKNAK